MDGVGARARKYRGDRRGLASGPARVLAVQTSRSSGVVVHRGAPAIAPAALSLVQLASSALGRAAMLDGERRLGRQPPLAGCFFARLQALGGLLIKLLGHR